MSGRDQLEHEIRRHLAMAQLTGGAIRSGHQEAARLLSQVLDEIGGEAPSQESRSAGRIRLRPRPSWAKRLALWLGKSCRGS